MTSTICVLEGLIQCHSSLSQSPLIYFTSTATFTCVSHSSDKHTMRPPVAWECVLLCEEWMSQGAVRRQASILGAKHALQCVFMCVRKTKQVWPEESRVLMMIRKRSSGIWASVSRSTVGRFFAPVFTQRPARSTWVSTTRLYRITNETNLY